MNKVKSKKKDKNPWKISVNYTVKYYDFFTIIEYEQNHK